jgi:Ferritin-like domain
MTTQLTRRRLFTVAAGGAALAALPLPPVALGATDDELAYANFSVSAELLLADLYEKALAAKVVAERERALVRAGRAAALRHADALSELLAGAGQDAPTAEDFAFQWPANAFATPAAVAATARVVLHAMLGVYQTAVAAVSEPSYRVLYASLGASIGQQLGALNALATSDVLEPFPVAVDLERASGALDRYLG